MPEGTRLWALLVGINKYEVNPLSGCLRDVENVQQYLVSDLGVPSENIKVLRDTECTRARILEEFFKHLVDNSNIRLNDAILFHYSGHGTFFVDDVPPSWRSTHLADPADAVEAICPIRSLHEILVSHPYPTAHWGLLPAAHANGTGEMFCSFLTAVTAGMDSVGMVQAAVVAHLALSGPNLWPGLLIRSMRGSSWMTRMRRSGAGTAL